ncbi:MAG: CHAT domain-containing protein [Minicystis sp.]
MKEHDPLVDALGHTLRNRAAAGEDPRWAELERDDLPPEAIDALVAGSPFDPAREQALIDRARARSQRPRRRPAWIAFALAAALGGALLLFLFARPSPPPEYALSASGDATVLAPDAAPSALRVSVGTRVRLALTPLSAERAGDVVVRLFLVSSTEVRALPARPQPSAAIRIEGLREELFPGAPAGSYELVVLLARAGASIDEAALAAMARDPARALAGWRAIRRPIELRGGAVAIPREVEEAAALRAAGKLDEAARALAAAPPGLPRTRLTARILLQSGRPAEAAPLFREAIAQGRAARDPEGASKDVLALSYLMLESERKPHDAAKLLDDNADLLAGWPASEADVLYVRGQIDRARGDFRGALANLREAARVADGAGLTFTRDAARELSADMLSTLGRHREALASVRSIALPEGSSCRAAEARTNSAWIEIRAARTGALGDTKRAAALLREALAIARASCQVGTGRVLTNLAIALLEAGDRDGARRACDDAEKAETTADPVDSVWWAQVRAEADLAEGRLDGARAHFDEARALGERHHLPEASFEGALGLALTLDASKDAGVDRAFASAASALETWAVAAPLGEGRGSFLAEHARAVRLHAASLLRRDRPADALDVVRSGAARYLALVDRPGAATAPPPKLAPGVALLAAVPLSEGPAAIAALGDHVEWARVSASDKDDLAAWIAPFAASIRAANRLLVPAGGALRGLDLHAAPLDGRPLVARLPVAYTLDLPARAPPPRPVSPVALIVADPARDLPAVRMTLAPLRATLEKQGLRVVLLEGDGATREAFRKAVSSPDVFFLHYAGHASFAGRDGLDAALALADGPFTVRDLLDSRSRASLCGPARLLLRAHRRERRQPRPGAGPARQGHPRHRGGPRRSRRRRDRAPRRAPGRGSRPGPGSPRLPRARPGRPRRAGPRHGLGRAPRRGGELRPAVTRPAAASTTARRGRGPGEKEFRRGLSTPSTAARTLLDPAS